jgi:glutathione S-transferase
MMAALRLLGYPVSNYFNIARAAMIEKALDFEVVLTRAAQDEPFLSMSPMGKIPVLETPNGTLAETVVILEFLDDNYSDVSLRPADRFQRAKGRQIVNVVQMYVEAPTRSLFPGVFMGGTNAPETEVSVRAMLDRSTAALSRMMQPTPFLFGDAISQADLFAFYNLDIADRLTRFVYGRSIIGEIGGLDDWQRRIADRASTRTVMADFEKYFAIYLEDKGASYSAIAEQTGHHAHA